VLLSNKFIELISILRKEYDFVILDCAPILQVSDYIHIGRIADGMLFVVAHEMTTKSMVADAMKELNKNGVQLLGTVFSMYNPKNSRGKYYYGYSGKYNYYQNYYEESKNK
jgi:Mrp family chromosome partitioning ATPase